MMRALVLILALALLPRPAAATQEYILPTLFDVTDVAADDVLNVRAGPGASFEVIGSLAPGATDVEVVSETGGWGRVNTGESSGWVSMRYLTYRTDVWEPGTVPGGFSCFGTEPFWSIDTHRFATPEDPDKAIETVAVLDSGVPRDPRRALISAGGDTRYTLSVTPQLCSDGMSDRLFGLGAMLVVEGEGQPEVLMTGCCSIAP